MSELSNKKSKFIGLQIAVSGYTVVSREKGNPMHNFGLVMVTRPHAGQVVGPPVPASKIAFRVLCRTCGMRPDGSGQIYGVGVLRRTPCTDIVRPRHN